MAGTSTATPASAAAACPSAITTTTTTTTTTAARRRPRREGGGGAMLACMLACLLACLSGALAASIYDMDDALLGSDLGDLRDVQDNRVRPDVREERSELLLVHVLFRHGDRTPDLPTYPNDPYANHTYYPVGPGALTAAGKRTEYSIGKFLRRRYGDFLGEYQNGLLSARTTDWPRTKDSMALVLAGLFPPSKHLAWTDVAAGGGHHDDDDLGLKWNPIAAESVPRSEDKLLYMLDVPCPAYDRALQETLHSPAFQKHFRGEKHATLISYLEKYSGAKIESPEDVYNIYQALLAQHGFGLTLPAWASEVFPERMKPLTAIGFELETYTRKMQRLRTGPLLKRILRHSVAKARGLLRHSARKLYLYSAHDNNVGAMLRSLQVWEPVVPPYGTTVIFEVRSKGGRVGMQLYLRNSTSNDIHALTIPNCEHFCPLHKFVELTAEVIPDDWDAECQENRTSESTTSTTSTRSRDA